MTTTHDPSTLPAVIPVQEISAAREQGILNVQQALNTVWALTEALSETQKIEAQTALMSAWNTAQLMSGQWAETQELLMRSVALVQGQQIALEEATQQRAAVLKEMSELLKAIKTIDLNHPVIQHLYGEVYEAAMEDHNGNFWESLPYDMAHTLGGKWEHMDADTLFQLIADEGLDLNAEAEYWTEEQIKWAREAMLEIVRQMQAHQNQALYGGDE